MIGILGGLGPAATVDILHKIVSLTPATKDSEHIPWIALNWPQIPDRSQAILANSDAPFAPMSKAVEVLNREQCSCIIIPCNTAHHWYGRLQKLSSIPILHIADASVAALKQHPDVKKVAVMATKGTIVSGFYQDKLERAGYRFFTPDDGGVQKEVSEVIALVKGGQVKAAAQPFLHALEVASSQGCQAALLACTELPMAAAEIAKQPLLLVDTNLELAKSALRFVAKDIVFKA